MRKYEVFFIFHSELDEDKLKKKIEEVKKYITSQKGKVVDVKELGRENLPYSIKKCIEGINVVMDMEISPETVDSFKKRFLKDEQILRYTVLKV